MNLNYTIEKENVNDFKILDCILGLLCGISFIIAFITTITGKIAMNSNLDSLLNDVAKNISMRYLNVHDYYVSNTSGVLYYFLLGVITILLTVIFSISIKRRWWGVFIVSLSIIAGTFVFLPNSLWVPGLLSIGFNALAIIYIICLGKRQRKYLIFLSVCVFFISIIFGNALININGDFKQTESPIKGFVYEIRFGDKGIGNLPLGDFSNLEGLELSNDVCLKVKMSKPQSYYLKGFVGEKYNGHGWEKIENKEKVKYNDLFYWLYKNQFISHSIMSTAEEESGLNYEKNTMEINNVGSDRHYIYLPYELDRIKDYTENSIDDGSLVSKKIFGEKKYTITTMESSVDNYYNILNKIYNLDEKNNQFLENEYNYKKYVYDNYLFLPPNTQEYLNSIIENKGKKNINEVKAIVLRYLNEFKYDESLAFNLDDGDFFEHFTETKSGYSVHFATASALIFRYYGIPARYVEGYLITPKDVKSGKKNKEIKVKGTNAHAWMEYYQDGIGWIPFETTSPYIGVMGSEDNISFLGDANQDNDIKDGQKQEEKKPKEKNTVLQQTTISYIGIAILVFLLIILIIIIVLILWTIKKKTGKKKRFDEIDDKIALKSMAFYVMEVLYKNGLEMKNIPYIEMGEEVKSIGGDGIYDEFMTFMKIYEKALYTPFELTKEERFKAKNFALNIKKSLRKRGKK